MTAEDSEQHRVRHIIEPWEELSLFVQVLSQTALTELQLFREVGESSSFGWFASMTTL